ncbi:MAG: serine protease AprX [Actinomycetota bacterium]|nr:serine protease AprX [Actinomycetota bacterium]
MRALLIGSALAALMAAGLTAPASASSAAPTLDPGLSTSGHALTKVVVSGRPGASTLVRQAVVAAGGSSLRPLAIVNGWSARVPADELPRLDRAAGVAAITADREVRLAGNNWDSSLSSSSFVWTSQAGPVWQSAHVDGSGISVAVLDTGVSAVPDLAGRVMAGPDLSGEGANTVDSYGHGTVMAGLIAGNGAASASAPRTGTAPGAEIISVKVAGANGASDVSTVLAGLSWVGAFKDVYNIRVLNLSWGVASTQDPHIDPINFAVERLWTMGVTVVVAAGNSGPATGTILKPGDDPLVITVGAYDDKGDAASANDSVPAWSSQGPTAAGLAKPDLVAPGRTLISVRSPGSTVERDNPAALVAPAYIKGSGSSQATAVTSGVVALLLDAHPSWTPDQVKYALTSTASRMLAVPTSSQGAGRIQASPAASANVLLAPTQFATATGLGSLDASRGTSSPLVITCGGQRTALAGDMTSWCAPWSSGAWTSGAWTSGAWTSGAWTSGAWTSGAWTSGAWTSGAWTSGAWTSGAWTSAEYADSSDDQSNFLTIFYGSHPKFGMKVKGEVSDPAPQHGNDQR